LRVGCACAEGRGGRGFWRSRSRLGENEEKWRTKKRLDRDAWRGVKVEKGAERLARFDSTGETTALLPPAMKNLPSTQQLLSSFNTYTAECCAIFKYLKISCFSLWMLQCKCRERSNPRLHSHDGYYSQEHNTYEICTRHEGQQKLNTASEQ
jgi:hypothetical protein